MARTRPLPPAPNEPAAHGGPDGGGRTPLLGSDPERTERRGPVRWMGWRLRLLVLATLVGCVGTLLLMRTVAATPTIDAVWRADVNDRVVLASSGETALQDHIGRVLTGVIGRDQVLRRVDDAVLQRAPRWTVDDDTRRRLVEMHRSLGVALSSGPVMLQFDGQDLVEVQPRPRGIGGLGLLIWPLAALALLVYLMGVVVWLVKPQLRNALYALIALCQAANLLYIALESARGLVLPDFIVTQDLWLRMALDMVTAAAIVHSVSLYPKALQRGGWIATGAWLVAACALAYARFGATDHGWWWAQGGIVALGFASIGVLSLSYKLEPNPFVAMLRRFGFVTMGSLSLLTLAVAAASSVPGVQHRVAEVGSVVWYVFFAFLLLLMPFMARSSQLLREFTLLAGISTVATSLDLIFVAIFSFGQFTSLTLSVFLSLGVYAGARQWILDQLTGSNVLTLERSFERLYSVARQVAARPDQHGPLMEGLLRDLFDPLEVVKVQRAPSRPRVVGDGSALLVPMPRAGGAAEANDPRSQAWLLRFARRGKRIFTEADARLADRVAEQLRRAVAYDQAVERGRSEERLRIAQDLHDDIGARLLTLMYRAQTPEIEDYVRNTLKDLKTLTRGLAATEHRLSHAAAEWKADIAQRLTAAHIELAWSFSYDEDMTLTVVQWSALTRVLRELVTNTIYHAQARRVEIEASLDKSFLSLAITDDGIGRDPPSWAHGLGLGGVRKRVKLLGGEVHWREHSPQGIRCEVRVPGLSDRAAPRSAPDG
jgi:signal transduction histidine kinase